MKLKEYKKKIKEKQKKQNNKTQKKANYFYIGLINKNNGKNSLKIAVQLLMLLLNRVKEI